MCMFWCVLPPFYLRDGTAWICTRRRSGYKEDSKHVQMYGLRSLCDLISLPSFPSLCHPLRLFCSCKSVTSGSFLLPTGFLLSLSFLHCERLLQGQKQIKKNANRYSQKGRQKTIVIWSIQIPEETWR